MMTLAIIIYLFMCWISNWNLRWPISMIINGGLGDKLIGIGWIALFIAAL